MSSVCQFLLCIRFAGGGVKLSAELFRMVRIIDWSSSTQETHGQIGKGHEVNLSPPSPLLFNKELVYRQGCIEFKNEVYGTSNYYLNTSN